MKYIEQHLVIVLQSVKNGFFFYGGSENLDVVENFLFKKICGPV